MPFCQFPCKLRQLPVVGNLDLLVFFQFRPVGYSGLTFRINEYLGVLRRLKNVSEIYWRTGKAPSGSDLLYQKPQGGAKKKMGKFDVGRMFNYLRKSVVMKSVEK
jgi:hypothetical protein